MASATLTARMIGDAKSLIGAVDKSDTKMGKFQKTMKAFQGPALVFGGAIAGATMKFAALGDEIAKMSTRTGFSTESLSEWRFAADQSGASLQGLEVGVRRMQRTIIDADSGLKSASDSLDMVGVSAEQLRALSPEQQFETLATAIASLEDPTLKAAAAQEIFGRQGTSLLPLFEAGAEGIADLRQEARDLGIVMDRETAAKAERMNDAINSAKQSLIGMAIDIGSTVAPAVSFIAEGFAKMPSILQKITVVAGIAFGAMKAGILSTKAALISTGLGIALIAIGEAYAFIEGRTRAATEASDQWLTVASFQNEALRAGEEITRRSVETLEAAIAAEQERIRAGEGNVEVLERQMIAVEGYRAALRIMGSATEDTTSATQRATAANRAKAASFRDLTSASLAAAIAERIYEAEQAQTEMERVAILHTLGDLITQFENVTYREQRLADIVKQVTGANDEQEVSWTSVGSAATKTLDAVSEKAERTAGKVTSVAAATSALLRAAGLAAGGQAGMDAFESNAAVAARSGGFGFNVGGLPGSPGIGGVLPDFASAVEALARAIGGSGGSQSVFEMGVKALEDQARSQHITIELGGQTLADIYIKGKEVAVQHGREVR